MANEKRLIDAKALFNDLADYWGIPKDWDGRIEQTCEDALCAIENAPEVDAVEVVRCKDCKHWEDGYFGYCTKVHTAMDYDGYCAYGERKDDVQEE